MARHGMVECDFYDQSEQWAYICFRGAVKSAIRGKRGQAFLKELIKALDAMPEKKLIEGELHREGEYCAIGTVGAARGVDLDNLDVSDYDKLGEVFGISSKLVQEIEWINDELIHAKDSEKDERRWQVVRDWAEAQLTEEAN